MAPIIPWDILKKHFQNNITETDNQELIRWRNGSKLNQLIFDEIAQDKNLISALVSGTWEASSSNWQDLLACIDTSPKQFVFNRNRFIKVAVAAASIILIMGLALGYLFNQIGETGRNTLPGYTQVFSPRGQRTKVILPDNSIVWLNGESSIKYPAEYNQINREVFLSGEAFFEVKKNTRKPFFVNADEIKIRVYGTSFNVKAFPEEKYIETTLIEGKLSVVPVNQKNQSNQEFYLRPNEKCIFEKASERNPSGHISIGQNINKANDTLKQSKTLAIHPQIEIMRNIDIEEEKHWKDGILLFQNESFGELAAKLERWYNVKIHFEDEAIKDYKFTGSFEKETINQAMDALQLSSQQSYQYRMEFRDIYLTSK